MSHCHERKVPYQAYEYSMRNATHERKLYSAVSACMSSYRLVEHPIRAVCH